MAEITITTEKLDEIIEKSFKRGEQWGITHSTWFTPSEEDQKEKIQESKDAMHCLLLIK